MKIIKILLVVFGAVAMTACSGKSSNGATSIVSDSDIESFTGGNAIAASATIDSLALEADFLTPRQAVSVLIGLNEIVKAEQEKGKSGRRLEYMRKYIDTYDILSDRGEEFSDAFDEVKLRHHIDFAAICKSYRDILSDEADGSTVEDGAGALTDEAPAAQKADTAKTAPVELPEPKQTPADPQPDSDNE